MPIDKTELFDPADVRMSSLAKALGHPARVAILRELAAHQTCACSAIVDCLPLAQATVSQHLKELKEAGLITGEINGPSTCYCLDLEGIGRAHDAMEEFLRHLKDRATQFCC